MKLAPILTATVLASLYMPAIAQETAPVPPIPPAAAPVPAPAPDARKNMRYQTFSRSMSTDDMRPGMRIGPPGIWWKNPDLIQKLSITADQQKRMDDIFQQSRLQLIDLKANVEKQEVTLEPMLSANPPDTNKVLGQIDKVASARAELEKANAKMLLGIRGILSADQWTKLQAEQRENRRIMLRFNPGPDGPGFMFHGPEGIKGPGGPESLRGPGAVTIYKGHGGPLSMMTLPPMPLGDSIGLFTQGPTVDLDLLDDDDLDL